MVITYWRKKSRRKNFQETFTDINNTILSVQKTEMVITFLYAMAASVRLQVPGLKHLFSWSSERNCRGANRLKKTVKRPMLGISHVVYKMI
jgi:hypothetical protein